MVGTPSSRGCEACRRQKKKCDEVQPVCSRCARLRIPCLGPGERRYKFKNQTLATTTGTVIGSAGSSSVPAVQALGHVEVALLALPSSEVTMATSRFVSALEVLDPRFDLTIYGNFVREIPRRLGTNEALDAAVGTLTTALPLVHTRQQSAELYHKYVEALQSLRVCLGDPAKAASPNTLCALYFVIICQGWTGGRDDYYPMHGEAIAHILSSARLKNWDDPFEKDLLTTLCVLVIFESFINPRIQLDPQLWDLPETFGPCSPADEQSNIDSLRNRNLARFTVLIRDPEPHLREIATTYQRVRTDCAKMAAILAQIPVVAGGDGRLTTPLPTRNRRLHVRWQTGYGILLFIAIILNAILRAYQGAASSSSLADESADFIASVLTLAEQAMQYRPLGSSATPVYLVAAYAALEGGESESERVEALLAEYQSDFKSARWLDMARMFRARLWSPRPNLALIWEGGYGVSCA